MQRPDDPLLPIDPSVPPPQTGLLATWRVARYRRGAKKGEFEEPGPEADVTIPLVPTFLRYNGEKTAEGMTRAPCTLAKDLGLGVPSVPGWLKAAVAKRHLHTGAT